MTATLQYNNHSLVSTTIDGRSPDDVASDLYLTGYTYLALEPGDATRYAIHLFRHPVVKPRELFGVTFELDGRKLRTIWYNGSKDALQDLSPREWDREVLGWYLDQVMEAL